MTFKTVTNAELAEDAGHMGWSANNYPGRENDLRAAEEEKTPAKKDKTDSKQMEFDFS